MIRTENIVLNGKTFKRTYSDNNKLIQKVGTNDEYAEAIDLPDSPWTYEETLIDIEPKESFAN